MDCHDLYKGSVSFPPLLIRPNQCETGCPVFHFVGVTVTAGIGGFVNSLMCKISNTIQQDFLQHFQGFGDFWLKSCNETNLEQNPLVGANHIF